MPPTKNPAAKKLAEMIESVHASLLLDLSHELENYGFRLQSYCLLELIGKQTQAESTKQIAEQTNQTKAAASDMIIRLEHRGYLITRPAKDRRKIRIELTLKGIKFVEQMRDELATRVSQLMGTLNLSEQKTWLRISETILETGNPFAAAPDPQPLLLPPQKPGKRQPSGKGASTPASRPRTTAKKSRSGKSGLVA